MITLQAVIRLLPSPLYIGPVPSIYPHPTWWGVPCQRLPPFVPCCTVGEFWRTLGATTQPLPPLGGGSFWGCSGCHLPLEEVSCRPREIFLVGNDGRFLHCRMALIPRITIALIHTLHHILLLTQLECPTHQVLNIVNIHVLIQRFRGHDFWSLKAVAIIATKNFVPLFFILFFDPIPRAKGVTGSVQLRYRNYIIVFSVNIKKDELKGHFVSQFRGQRAEIFPKNISATTRYYSEAPIPSRGSRFLASVETS